MFGTTHGTISENTFCKLLCHKSVLPNKNFGFALCNVKLAIVWFGNEKVANLARKKFRFRLSLSFGIFAVRKDFLASTESVVNFDLLGSFDSQKLRVLWP